MVAVRTTTVQPQGEKFIPLHQWNALKRNRPDLDLDAYNRALSNERRARKQDQRSVEQQMTDKALIQKVDAAIETPGINTKDDMIKAVRVAYGGNGSMTDTHINALALLCWELGLSPNPALGHVWIIPNGKDKDTGKEKVIIMTGIYGLVNLARRDHDFILRDARAMTDEERAKYGLNDGDVGVICPIIDMRQGRAIAELAKAGLPVTLADAEQHGIGIWRKEVKRWNKYDKKWELKEDNVWQGGTPFLTARKRAIANALKLLGLNSGVGRMPDLTPYGMQFDPIDNAYLPADVPAKQDLSDILEAEFNQQLEAEIDLESNAPSVEDTSVESLIDTLRSEAESTRATPPVVIDANQLKHFHTVLSKLSKVDAEKKAFIKAVFGRDSSKALEVCEYEAIVNWIAADEETARQAWGAWVVTLQQGGE